MNYQPNPLCAIIGVICLALMDAAGAQTRIELRDVSESCRIDFRHTSGGCGQRYIVETITAGVALFDYDGDGDGDVYLLNGAPLKGASPPHAPPDNRLYRNDGNFRFTDVTQQAGVGDTGYGLGVAAADFDNDGDQDLYVNNYGPNVFYRNNGDGTFNDATGEMSLANGHKVGGGVCFLDIENDGDLDIYAANYVEFTYDNHRVDFRGGIPIYAGPDFFPPVADNLFRNNGDGTFSDISRQAGIDGDREWGMACIAADFDDDGDADVFVCNDSTRNCYFENDGSGRFTENGLLAGLAYDGKGRAQGSMGVDCADYDNDGLLDLFQTSYQAELPVLYRNVGGGVFDDVTLRTGAGVGAFHTVEWGVGFVDFDHDADKDLFLACGHVLDNIELVDDTNSFLQANILLENLGNGRFANVTADAGDGMAPIFSSRGCGFDDLDNDGDIDVVVLNWGAQVTCLRNDSREAGNWVKMRLVGVEANRDGVGARVRITTGTTTQTAVVHSGRGYQSHFGSELHFGLGERSEIDRIEVRWSNGRQQTFENSPVNQTLIAVQGQGQLHRQAD